MGTTATRIGRVVPIVHACSKANEQITPSACWIYAGCSVCSRFVCRTWHLQSQHSANNLIHNFVSSHRYHQLLHTITPYDIVVIIPTEAIHDLPTRARLVRDQLRWHLDGYDDSRHDY